MGVADDRVAAARRALDESVMLAVRVVFDDGQEERTWTWREVQNGRSPALKELQDWMVEPRKSWPRPEDPIIYSTRVAPGREDDARAWLAALTVEEAR